MRTLHAGGGLNLITRDHRAGLGQHHPHFHAKVFELFLDHAAGHLQRFDRDRFLVQLGLIEQRNLRQIAVRHLHEQGLLPLFGHALAGGQIQWFGLGDQHRLHVLLNDFFALFAHDLFALAHGLQTDLAVLGHLPLFTYPQPGRFDACAQVFTDP